MKNAKEARQETIKNVNEFNTERTVLLSAFEDKIEEACKKGEYVVNGFKLPQDRFKPDVIESVLTELKSKGYTTDIAKHNALQTVTFTVKWK